MKPRHEPTLVMKHTATGWLVVAAALTCVPWLASSCLGDIDVGDTSASVSSVGGGGAGGDGGAGGVEEVCDSPPSGFCSTASDCECTACSPAATCTPGGCMANNFCDLSFEDTCICSDCDFDAACVGPLGGGACTDDGRCDTMTESCACADCFDEPTCKDNQELCAGGAPDGTCDRSVESCGCNDCVGSLDCLCASDGFCGIFEPCVCEDCWQDLFCSEPDDCLDDGDCSWGFEGCQCQDCSPLPICDDFP